MHTWSTCASASMLERTETVDHQLVLVLFASVTGVSVVTVLFLYWCCVSDNPVVLYPWDLVGLACTYVCLCVYASIPSILWLHPPACVRRGALESSSRCCVHPCPPSSPIVSIREAACQTGRQQFPVCLSSSNVVCGVQPGCWRQLTSSLVGLVDELLDPPRPAHCDLASDEPTHARPPCLSLLARLRAARHPWCVRSHGTRPLSTAASVPLHHITPSHAR
jgi:hypothetical protein